MSGLSITDASSLSPTGGGASTPAERLYLPPYNPSFEGVNDVRRYMHQAGWGDRPGEAQTIFDSGIKVGDLIEAQIDSFWTPMMYAPPLRSDGVGVGDNNARVHLTSAWIEYITANDGTPEHNEPRAYPTYVRGDPFRSRITDAMIKIWCIGFVQTTEFGSTLQARQYNAFAGFIDKGTIRDVIDWLNYDTGMGRFLDNGDNNGFVGGADVEPNQNWVRELFQLFTTGMIQLNTDGTPVLDVNGNTIPTYYYEDVFALTRIFSGMSVYQYSNVMRIGSSGHRGAAYSPYLDFGRSAYGGTPTVGSRRVPTPQTAHGDMCIALDKICDLDQTLTYVALHFIHELVTENPTPAYVRRVVAALQDDGKGIRGSLRAMIRAILIDPEARGNSKAAGYGRARDFITAVGPLWRSGQQQALFRNFKTQGDISAGSPTISNIHDAGITAAYAGGSDSSTSYVFSDNLRGSAANAEGIPHGITLAAIVDSTTLTMSGNATHTKTNFQFELARHPSCEVMRGLAFNTSGWDSGASNNSIFAIQPPGFVPSVFSFYPFDFKIAEGVLGRACALWDTTGILAWWKATLGLALGHVATYGGLSQVQAGAWDLTAMVAGAPTNTQLIDRAIDYLLVGRTLPADSRTELIGLLDDLVTLDAGLYSGSGTPLSRRAAIALAAVAMMPEYMEQM